MKIINGVEFYTLNEKIEMYADEIGLEIPVKITNKRAQVDEDTAKKTMQIYAKFSVIASSERIEELIGLHNGAIYAIRNNVKL
jgi:hypothetical protein